MTLGKTDIIEAWMKEAGSMTYDKFPEFFERLSNTPKTHDFEVCAVSAAAVAAAWAMNDKIGSLSNCGASQVMWEFIKSWMGKSSPMRLLCFDEMLYPQFENRFEKTLDPETAQWLKMQAHSRMQRWFKDEKYRVSPEVLFHWDSIDCGNLPFGYRVSGTPEKPTELKTQADVLKAWREGKLVLR